MFRSFNSFLMKRSITLLCLFIGPSRFSFSKAITSLFEINGLAFSYQSVISLNQSMRKSFDNDKAVRLGSRCRTPSLFAMEETPTVTRSARQERKKESFKSDVSYLKKLTEVRGFLWTHFSLRSLDGYCYPFMTLSFFDYQSGAAFLHHRFRLQWLDGCCFPITHGNALLQQKMDPMILKCCKMIKPLSSHLIYILDLSRFIV